MLRLGRLAPVTPCVGPASSTPLEGLSSRLVSSSVTNQASADPYPLYHRSKVGISDPVWRSPEYNKSEPEPLLPYDEFIEKNEEFISHSGDPVRHLKMNLPLQYNVLDSNTQARLYRLLQKWGAEQSSRAIILDGVEDFFCCGSDLRSLYQTVLSKDNIPRELGSGAEVIDIADYYRHQYKLFYLLFRMRKPFLPYVVGKASGAGVGLALMSPLSIGTEKTNISVNSGRVGLPIEGGSVSWLSKLPFNMGRMIGLTGITLSDYDYYHLGKISHLMVKDMHPWVKESLGIVWSQEWRRVLVALGESAIDCGPFRFSQEDLEMIHKAFGHDTVEEIIIALETQPNKLGWQMAGMIKKASPLASATSLELLKRSEELNTKQSLKLEHRAVRKSVEQSPDFREGVESQVLSRRAPRWAHTHSSVTAAEVENYLTPYENVEDELSLRDPFRDVKHLKFYPHSSIHQFNHFIQRKNEFFSVLGTDADATISREKATKEYIQEYAEENEKYLSPFFKENEVERKYNSPPDSPLYRDMENRDYAEAIKQLRFYRDLAQFGRNPKGEKTEYEKEEEGLITREDVEEGLEKFGQEMKDALKKRTPRTLEEYMSTGAGSRLPDRDMQLTPEEQEEKKKLQERYAAYYDEEVLKDWALEDNAADLFENAPDGAKKGSKGEWIDGESSEDSDLVQKRIDMKMAEGHSDESEDYEPLEARVDKNYYRNKSILDEDEARWDLRETLVDALKVDKVDELVLHLNTDRPANLWNCPEREKFMSNTEDVDPLVSHHESSTSQFEVPTQWLILNRHKPMSFRNDVDRYVLSLWVAWSGIDLKEEVAPRDVFYEMLGDDLKVDPSLKCISEGASYLSSFLPAHTEVLNEDHFLPSKEIHEHMSKTDYAAFKQDLFKLQTDLEEDIEAAFENQDLEDGASDLKLIKEMLEEKFILPADKNYDAHLDSLLADESLTEKEKHFVIHIDRVFTKWLGRVYHSPQMNQHNRKLLLEDLKRMRESWLTAFTVEMVDGRGKDPELKVFYDQLVKKDAPELLCAELIVSERCRQWIEALQRCEKDLFSMSLGMQESIRELRADMQFRIRKIAQFEREVGDFVREARPHIGTQWYDEEIETEMYKRVKAILRRTVRIEDYITIFTPREFRVLLVEQLRKQKTDIIPSDQLYFELASELAYKATRHRILSLAGLLNAEEKEIEDLYKTIRDQTKDDLYFGAVYGGRAIKKFRPPDLPDNFRWEDQEKEAAKRGKVYSSNAEISLGDEASESGEDSENPFAKRPGYWDGDREKLPSDQESGDGAGSGVEEYQGGAGDAEASDYSQPSEMDLDGDYQNLDLSGVQDFADEY